MRGRARLRRDRPQRGLVYLAVLLAVGALALAAVLVGEPTLTNAASSAGSANHVATPVHTVRTGVFAAPSTSTPSGAEIKWSSKAYSITFDGLTRNYMVFTPGTVSASQLPVIVELGGCCTTVDVEIARADFRQVASPAILVYPEYVDGNWNAGACCGTPATEHVDDVGFVNAVISDVKASQRDASQGPVYLAGYSNGGKLAMMLACEEPSEFVAVAVYGATRTSDCTTLGSESVLITVGSADPGTAISGPPVVQNGYTEPTVDQLVAEYRSADGCSQEASTTTLGVATETLWAECQGGRQVGEVVYEGDNHTWPEASGATPSAQSEMWRFFASLGA